MLHTMIRIDYGIVPMDMVEHLSMVASIVGNFLSCICAVVETKCI